MGWVIRGGRGGGRFSAPVQTGSTQPHVQWVPVLFPGTKAAETAEIEERVALYL